MKGIILAGGSGTRLSPLTKVTSKQLLPIYHKPMIYYPLETLMRGGIREILIITAPDRAGDFLRLLGSGKELGAKFTYEIQDKPEGIAQAFIIGENFIGDDSVALILGDNIFEDDFSQAIKSFKTGGHVFAKQVPDPERFGVVKFDGTGKAEQIVEKPKEHVSDYAVTGLYLYDNRVVGIAKNLKPSSRGELEITDVNNAYLQRGELTVSAVAGAWLDAGTFDSLLAANLLIAKREGSRILS
ncbi:MAG: NTP transferase domain-containing protein [Parcubacteria group bacterium]|nr:NTP transferase domain-containing protein [Parcubacteria group bacterium]